MPLIGYDQTVRMQWESKTKEPKAYCPCCGAEVHLGGLIGGKARIECKVCDEQMGVTIEQVTEFLPPEGMYPREDAAELEDSGKRAVVSEITYDVTSVTDADDVLALIKGVFRRIPDAVFKVRVTSLAKVLHPKVEGSNPGTSGRG